MAEHDGSLGLGNRPVWFPSASGGNCTPYQANTKPNTLLFSRYPSPFGNFLNAMPGLLLSRATPSPSLSLAREPARTGLSRSR